MKEIWKDVVGYEPYYQVSNKGNVRSKKITTVNKYRSSQQRRFRKAALMKLQVHPQGYAQISFCIENKKKSMKVHQLVAKAFLSNPEKFYSINHINGIKTDNRVENLEWCTQAYNNQHAFRTGLKKGSQLGKFGVLHSRSKAVIAIKETAILEFESINICANELGVHSFAVCKAAKMGLWHRGYKFFYAA